MKNADKPISPQWVEINETTSPKFRADGLTKREYFAGLAMNGYLSDCQNANKSPDMVAEWSIENAEALLKKLGEKQ